jgi:hypothetical protein
MVMKQQLRSATDIFLSFALIQAFKKQLFIVVYFIKVRIIPIVPIMSIKRPD